MKNYILFYLFTSYYSSRFLAVLVFEGFGIPTNHERPFVNVFDDKGEQLKVLLSHPFTRDNSWQQYKDVEETDFLFLE